MTMHGRTPEQVAEALRLAEEGLRLVAESVRDHAICLLDRRGFVTTWNRGAERMTGYTADEIVGQHFSRFYREEDIRQDKCDRDLALSLRDGRLEDEGWRLRKDGSTFRANVVIAAVRDGEGGHAGYATVTHDLTAERRADQERTRLAQAQEANRLKDEFLATISHELRTPLNAILGWASLLKRRAIDHAVLQGLDTIRRNAQSQAKLVEDILDVSRIVTGKLRLDVKPANLSTIVGEAIDVVRPAADAKRVAIVVERFDEPALLVGDATRLQQVVWNLLSNAVKFTDSGGHVFVQLDQVGSHFHLHVRDTGKGIATDFLPLVFERFRQGDSSTTRAVGGLGLGLSIAKHIVELHGGRVSAESAGPGTGAAFHVWLPSTAVMALPSDAADSGQPEALRVETRLDGVRVLIVDDEADVRELMTILLRERGAQVVAVGCAEEGRAALDVARPHVIVSDIGLPGEDGYAFIRSVRLRTRERGAATPAVAVTAYAQLADRLRALDAGYHNHVSKPVDPEELVRVVRNLADFGHSSDRLKATRRGVERAATGPHAKSSGSRRPN
jgi:PAS domain S-box-containing protein